MQSDATWQALLQSKQNCTSTNTLGLQMSCVHMYNYLVPHNALNLQFVPLECVTNLIYITFETTPEWGSYHIKATAAHSTVKHGPNRPVPAQRGSCPRLPQVFPAELQGSSCCSHGSSGTGTMAGQPQEPWSSAGKTCGRGGKEPQADILAAALTAVT